MRIQEPPCEKEYEIPFPRQREEDPVNSDMAYISIRSVQTKGTLEGEGEDTWQ